MAAFGDSGTYISTTDAIVIDIARNRAGDKPAWIKPEEIATQFPNRIVVDVNKTNIAELVAWCFENGISRYHCEIVNFYSKPCGNYMRMFSFAKKEDAMAFKLAWA